MNSIKFVPFRHEHLHDAAAHSAAAGWPHRRQDWEMVLNHSTGWVAVRDQDVVGTTLRSDFGPDISTVNMIVVAEASRSRGLGRALVTRALDGEDRRDIRLVATELGMALYQKLGFEVCGRIVQFQGRVGNVPAPAIEAETAKVADFPRIAELEGASFCGERSALVDWLSKNAVLKVIRDSAAKVTGFGARRRFGYGEAIGPIVAPDLETAEALFLNLARGLEGNFLRIDTDETSGLRTMVEALALKQVDIAPVMQRGTRQPYRPRFALCSQALG